MIRFRIKLCCKYGRGPAKWGKWIEAQIESDKYQGMLDGLTRDRQVHAFEAAIISTD